MSYKPRPFRVGVIDMTMVFIGDNDNPRIIEKIMRNVSFKAFTIRIL